jgi:hypothetical protein
MKKKMWVGGERKMWSVSKGKRKLRILYHVCSSSFIRHTKIYLFYSMETPQKTKNRTAI